MAPSQDTVLGCIIKVSSSGGLEWGLAHALLKSLQVTAQPGLGTASLESRPGQDYEERNEKIERKCYTSSRQAWGTPSFHLGEAWERSSGRFCGGGGIYSRRIGIWVDGTKAIPGRQNGWSQALVVGEPKPCLGISSLCYGLNVCVPFQIIFWNPYPSVAVFRIRK